MRFLWLALILALDVSAHGEKHEKACVVPIPSVMNAEELQHLKEKLSGGERAQRNLRMLPVKPKVFRLLLRWIPWFRKKIMGKIVQRRSMV